MLVKVKVASICGTDLHIYEWDRWAQNRIHPPLIPGHEFCGEVAAFGDEVTSVKEGDFVSAEMHVACGKCLQCRTGEAHICQNVKIIGVDADGAFAEYVVIPESNIWKLDPAIPQEYASILDPLGNAVHSVLAGEIAAKTVAITGCGPIGLFSIAVARAVGATTIFAIEVNEHRRQLAREMKADFALDPSKDDVRAIVMEQTGGLGADVVLEMAGHPSAIRTAFDIVRRGGRISLLGLTSKPISLNFSEDIIFKGITVQGISGRRMYQTWYQMTALVESGETGSSSRDHRSHRDERLLQGHGAAEDGRGEQDSGLSQRDEIKSQLSAVSSSAFSQIQFIGYNSKTMLRYFTAGESHGEALVAFLSGLPAGLKVDQAFLDRELWRRQQGFGRGGRMKIETDKAHILSGVRHGATIGSPIAILLENKDWKNWQESLPVEEGDSAKA